MMKLAAFASLVGSAAAFAPASTGKAATALSAEMSKAMPFLTAPTNLDGYVGGVGFDPLGFSDNFDPKWLVESEIKHGRVAMLAAAGFMASQFVNFPMYADMHVDDSNLAPQVVGVSAMLQIVCAAGIEEWRTNNGNVTMETMFANQDRAPGALGFDPMGMMKGKSEAEINDLKLKEIKNGRLAMLAIGGMIHHNFVTGDALF
mmetsp:Transcript_11761/g.24770  ORF Transcript_11761/g.24770 Transcript_11761/m.24770 type:complete len:203 (+) Transcript_11761:146-754(+)